jgi:hypothetical protein
LAKRSQFGKIHYRFQTMRRVPRPRSRLEPPAPATVPFSLSAKAHTLEESFRDLTFRGLGNSLDRTAPTAAGSKLKPEHDDRGRYCSPTGSTRHRQNPARSSIREQRTEDGSDKDRGSRCAQHSPPKANEMRACPVKFLRLYKRTSTERNDRTLNLIECCPTMQPIRCYIKLTFRSNVELTGSVPIQQRRIIVNSMPCTRLNCLRTHRFFQGLQRKRPTVIDE